MQTITISTKTYEKILSKLEHLSQEVESIKIRLSEKKLPYGSDEWWKWSDQEAKVDIQAGRVMTFDSAEEAIKWLNS